jgi:hypothetical protein
MCVFARSAGVHFHTLLVFTLHTLSVFNFISPQANPDAAETNTVIISAWNEHDEGHWIAPALPQCVAVGFCMFTRDHVTHHNRTVEWIIETSSAFSHNALSYSL